MSDARPRPEHPVSSAAPRHGSGPAAPVEALLWDDPELALVYADPHAYMLAHPCGCDALCTCDDAQADREPG